MQKESTLKTVIIDDEEDGVNVLKKLTSLYFPHIDIVGSAGTVKAGEKLIAETNPNLVFLDVELPDGNGFELLARTMDASFDVIFTTAHSHYAIRAIRTSAIDYLLKPIDIDELEKAVNRIGGSEQREIRRGKLEVLTGNLNGNKPTKLVLPDQQVVHFLEVKDILMVEARNNYSVFYLTSGESYVSTRNLKVYEDLLGDDFFRCHQSHLIRLDQVKGYDRFEGVILMRSGSSIPLARRRKDEFTERMNKLT